MDKSKGLSIHHFRVQQNRFKPCFVKLLPLSSFMLLLLNRVELASSYLGTPKSFKQYNLKTLQLTSMRRKICSISDKRRSNECSKLSFYSKNHCLGLNEFAQSSLQYYLTYIDDPEHFVNANLKKALLLNEERNDNISGVSSIEPSKMGLGLSLLDTASTAINDETTDCLTPSYTTKSCSTYTLSLPKLPLLPRLSKSHQSILAKTNNMRRQRFVTGKYPLYVSVKQNPTAKWLGLPESQIYLNGTSIEKSLASHDTFHWLDENERKDLHGDYEFLSLELLAEIRVSKPGYVNILPRDGAGSSITRSSQKHVSHGMYSNIHESGSKFLDSSSLSGKERLWITGFSLLKQRGELHTLDLETGVLSNAHENTARGIKWPNEVSSIPQHSYTNNRLQTCNSVPEKVKVNLDDALLVTDGFLVPGKDKGGLYIVRNPGNPLTERKVCLTGVPNLRGVPINNDDGDWFYHRAIWIDLTGDGRQSILAARAKLTSRGVGKGQLVWLERPVPHSLDVITGTPLNADRTVFDPFDSRVTPWKVRVLDEGPDVMFSVADLDPTDGTVEVIASQFFSQKVTLHSIQISPTPKVVFSRIIDDKSGAAFSCLLADLDGISTVTKQGHEAHVVDSGSTVASLNHGDPFSHLLVTSHECSFAEIESRKPFFSVNKETIETKSSTDFECDATSQSKINGGSLFAYRIPKGKDSWKTSQWSRSVVATGFTVQGHISNMINPGAPGFCYTFFPQREIGGKRGRKWIRPLIGISGDGAESAYILRPMENTVTSPGCSDCGIDRSTKYALMCEIKCQSTVGSLAIGYDDLGVRESSYAKIYVPCYERDKVLVFALGSGGQDC